MRLRGDTPDELQADGSRSAQASAAAGAGAARLAGAAVLGHSLADGQAAPVGRTHPLMYEDERSFLNCVSELSGIPLNAYRSETLRRRLPSCMRALRVESLTQARRALQDDPARLSSVLEALIIGVTEFYRNPAVFTALHQHVLPRLAHRGRALHIWSAGCSDGAEPYSLAIVAAELGLLNRCCLVATDCRAAAIARARDGIYTETDLRTLPAQHRDAFFTPEPEGRFQVIRPLRSVIQWRVADLLAGPQPGPWDLICCRNLLMYMQEHVAGQIWEMLELSLRPGGILLTGKAERPPSAHRLSPVGPCIYCRDRG